MEKTTEQSLQVLRQESSSVEKEVLGLTIKNDEDLALVSDRIKQVKQLEKRVKEEQEKFTQPAKEIISQAKVKYGPFIERCKSWESLLKKKAAEYMSSQQKARQEEEEKLAKRVEKGTMKEETALRKLESLPESKSSFDTGKSSVRMRMIKSIEVVDETLLPREYLMPNMAKLKAAALQEGKTIPGIKVVEQPSMASY